jgi:hypothetical protein
MFSLYVNSDENKPAGNFDQLRKLDLNTCGNLKSLANKSIFPPVQNLDEEKKLVKAQILTI